MEDKKYELNENDAEKVSGGSMKFVNVKGSLDVSATDENGNKISGNIKVKGPLTIPYCDVCGKEFDNEKITTFMYNGTVHHMCEHCHKNGCMSIFK